MEVRDRRDSLSGQLINPQPTASHKEELAEAEAAFMMERTYSANEEHNEMANDD